MPQPNHPELEDRTECDPLLAFDAEPGAPELPETPADPTPVAPPPAAENPSPLQLRLEQAERSLDRALTETAKLTSDVATLVASVDDLQERLSRKPERSLDDAFTGIATLTSDVATIVTSVDDMKERLSRKAERSLDDALTEIATLKSDVATLVASVDDMNERLGRKAERSLDHTRTEVATLKSVVATLVTAVDDMKKRLNRKAEPLPIATAVLPRGDGALSTAAAMVLFLTIGAAIWGVWSIRDAVSRDRVANEATAAPVETALNSPLTAPNFPGPAPNPIVQTAASVTPLPPVRASGERPPTPSAGYVGTLSIDSSPGGRVFIDRKPAGRTPLRVERLRAGSHLIWIEREGYRRWTRVVTVAANRVSRVSAGLDRLQDDPVPVSR